MRGVAWGISAALLAGAVSCSGARPSSEGAREKSASAPAPAGEGYIPIEPGVRLAYRSVGSGPGALVVVRAGDPGKEFERLARGRRVILYYPRGRSLSGDVDPSRISFENELSDLEAVRKFFGLEKMQLLGWSHYGVMTAAYAMRHPDRVSRLVQMTPGAPVRAPYLDEGMRAMRQGVDEAARKALQESIQAGQFTKDPEGRCRATRRAFLTAFVGDPADAAKLNLDDCKYPNEWEESQARWWDALFASMGDWDYRKEARALAVPRLVLHGEKDFLPLSGSRDWVAGNPHARLLVISGAGHFPHVEKPEVFFPAVEEFLGGSWPEGAASVDLPAAPWAVPKAPALDFLPRGGPSP